MVELQQVQEKENQDRDNFIKINEIAARDRPPIGDVDLLSTHISSLLRWMRYFLKFLYFRLITAVSLIIVLSATISINPEHALCDIYIEFEGSHHADACRRVPTERDSASHSQRCRARGRTYQLT